MHGSYHDDDDDEHNGSKAVSLLLRLANLALALTSAVIMATASSCTFNNGASATVVTFRDYSPFVYLVWSSIAAAVLQAAGIYLQLAGGGEAEDGSKKKQLPGILLVVIDVAVQALLYSATGAVVTAELLAYQHDEIKACTGTGTGRLCDDVRRSKLFSLAASFTISLAAVAKDVPLPFSVWPAASSSESDC